MCAPAQHITLVTYGAVVPRALQAAQKAQQQGIDVEILDLRTLNPYDWEAIATSVRKTSRVIVAHEDMLSWGYGAEIAARIADELFEISMRRCAASARWIRLWLISRCWKTRSCRSRRPFSKPSST